MDILPTGSNMVTRSPLHLELIQNSDCSQAIFGNYKDGLWIETKVIDITYPDITKTQKLSIMNQIQAITNVNAGCEMNISKNPSIHE